MSAQFSELQSQQWDEAPDGSTRNQAALQAVMEPDLRSSQVGRWDGTSPPDGARLAAETFRVGGPAVGHPAVVNGVDLDGRSGPGQKACGGCCSRLGWGWEKGCRENCSDV